MHGHYGFCLAADLPAELWRCHEVKSIVVSDVEAGEEAKHSFPQVHCFAFFLQGVTLEEESPLDKSTAQVCNSNAMTRSKEGPERPECQLVHLLKPESPSEICNRLCYQLSESRDYQL